MHFGLSIDRSVCVDGHKKSRRGRNSQKGEVKVKGDCLAITGRQGCILQATKILFSIQVINYISNAFKQAFEQLPT